MILVDEKSFSPNAMRVADDIAQLNMVEVAGAQGEVRGAFSAVWCSIFTSGVLVVCRGNQASPEKKHD